MSPTPSPNPRRRNSGTRDVFAERFARYRQRLSPSFRRVAEFIDANRVDVLTFSAIELGRAAGTSDATVIRAVQALGFHGLHDLRAELSACLTGRDTPADNLTRTWAELGENAEAAMDEVIASLADAQAALDAGGAMRDAMMDALRVLHLADRIAVFGVGPTAHVAAHFAARLRRKGRSSLVLDQMGAGLADQLLDLSAGDAVVMLSFGRSYREAEATIFEARRQNLPIVLVTDLPEEKTARASTVVLEIPRGRSGRVASHVPTLACLEMLLLGLATTGREISIHALEELERLRELTRPGRRAISDPRADI